MIYLLYGMEDFLIKREIKKIIKKNQLNDCDINTYNLEESDLKNILDDASTYSLFSDKRMIIVENSYIFTGSSKKTQDTKCLEKYLKDKNHSNILIFTVNHEKLDSRKKIVTLIRDNWIVLEFNEVTNLNNIIIELFGEYKIDYATIRLLIDRVGNNLNLLNQEINKIKTYKGNDYNITNEDILNLTIKTIDVDIFHLIDNIILNHKEKALESYYEMIKLGEEPIKIIVMLANQFRLIYQVKNLKKQGLSVFDMMSILGQKKYPIEKALDKSRLLTNEQLIKNIEDLAKLDIQIKTGNIDKNIGLELFILNN